MDKYIKYEETIDQLDINKGDTLLIASDLSILGITAMRNGEKFDPNCLIDRLIERVGESGTLLFPTYNWDFCNGTKFDYHETLSKTGALSKAALKRTDFIRTKHPIYSFAAWGKDRQKLFELNNKSAFGEDSPFAYLRENHAKMVMIGVNYQNSFTFVHHVEEFERVTYRYLKEFTGPYIDENRAESVRAYSMYVRDLEKGVVTEITSLGKELEKKNVSKRTKINGVDFYVIDLKKAFDVIVYDIRNNEARKLYMIEKRI